MYILTTEQKQEVIKHLRGLGSGEIQPDCSKRGLCNELQDLFPLYSPEYELYDLVKEHSKTWSKYSGNDSYPVPCPDDFVRPERSPTHYTREKAAYCYSSNVWDDNTYGNDRRELCLHIANELQKELDLKEKEHD